MVFGTFDIVHKGHLYFLQQARKLAKNPFLVASIARDVNVERVKERKTLYTERTRAKHVKATGLADKVVLGSLKDHIGHILKEAPDIIALGYDQQGYYVDETLKFLKEKGLSIKVKRLKPFHPEKYKSSILKKGLKY